MTGMVDGDNYSRGGGDFPFFSMHLQTEIQDPYLFFGIVPRGQNDYKKLVSKNHFKRQ